MSGKILIIDDKEKIIKMMQRRLTKAGYAIESENDGKSGLEHALRMQPDVILMDMHMPILNGYEAVGILREKDYCGPIVAINASVTREDRDKALQAGCDFFIAKPIDDTFELQIRNIFERKIKEI